MGNNGHPPRFVLYFATPSCRNGTGCPRLHLTAAAKLRFWMDTFNLPKDKDEVYDGRLYKADGTVPQTLPVASYDEENNCLQSVDVVITNVHATAVLPSTLLAVLGQTRADWIRWLFYVV